MPISSPRKRSVSGSVGAADGIRALTAAAEVNRPPPNYLRRAGTSGGAVQTISERQREKVVKYINELAEDFELCVQTGSLAVNYFDRYLAALYSESSPELPADRRQIQMIASTCLLLAAKFFDRKLPPLSELEKVHHSSVTAIEFSDLELSILSRLHWKLHVPLPHSFAVHILAALPGVPFTSRIEERMNFFIDLSVYGYQFLEYTPAAVAAAALLTAWTFSEEHGLVACHIGTMATVCGLDENILSACVNELVRYYQMCFPEAAAQCSNPVLFIPIASMGGMGGRASTEPTPTTPTTVNPSPVNPSPSPAEMVSTLAAEFGDASGDGSRPSGDPKLALLHPSPSRRTPESIMAAEAALVQPPTDPPNAAKQARAVGPESMMIAVAREQSQEI